MRVTQQEPSKLAKVQSVFANGLSRALRQVEVRPERVLAELQTGHGLPVRSIHELLAIPAVHLDAFADQTISSALKMAALEGAGFGMFGALALIPDTGVLAAITVQMIQRLSLIYGFEISTDEERAELWLAAASALGLDFGKELIEKEVLARIVPRVMAKIAERFGIEMAERLPAKVVPVLGSILGAGLNYWFIKSWGKRVKEHFRQKHEAFRSQLLLEQHGPQQLVAD